MLMKEICFLISKGNWQFCVTADVREECKSISCLQVGRKKPVKIKFGCNFYTLKGHQNLDKMLQVSDNNI
jgi:hypothetical protein